MGFSENIGELLTTSFMRALRDMEAGQTAPQLAPEVDNAPSSFSAAPMGSFDPNIGEQLRETFGRALRDLEAQQDTPVTAPTAPAYAPTL